MSGEQASARGDAAQASAPHKVTEGRFPGHPGVWALRIRTQSERILRPDGRLTPAEGLEETVGQPFQQPSSFVDGGARDARRGDQSEPVKRAYFAPVNVILSIVWTPEFTDMSDLCDALSLGRIVPGLRLSLGGDAASHPGIAVLKRTQAFAFGGAGLVSIEPSYRQIAGWTLS